MIGLIAVTAIFAAGLWYTQTRAHYDRVEGINEVVIGGVSYAVGEYQGLDGASSPLKLRGCFRIEDFGVIIADPAADPTPLIAPDWFECFDAVVLTEDITSGAAQALLAETNAPYGFDRIVALYDDGRAFQWRQINACGEAKFSGDPLPDGCPPAE